MTRKQLKRAEYLGSLGGVGSAGPRLRLFRLIRGRRHVVDLFQVDLEVVGALEHLAARAAGVGHEPALVLVAHVTEEGALEVEAPAAREAPELEALRRRARDVRGPLPGRAGPLRPARPRAGREVGRGGREAAAGVCNREGDTVIEGTRSSRAEAGPGGKAPKASDPSARVRGNDRGRRRARGGPKGARPFLRGPTRPAAGREGGAEGRTPPFLLSRGPVPFYFFGARDVTVRGSLSVSPAASRLFFRTKVTKKKIPVRTKTGAKRGRGRTRGKVCGKKRKERKKV